MKSLKINSPYQIIVSEENFDTSFDSHEALISIKRVSICGSDYKLYAGKYNAPNIYPITPGHEWSGIVLEAGNNNKGIKKGDRVTGDCSIWCGNCEYCKINKNLCSNIRKYGINTDGFVKELAKVPLKYLYKAPDSVSFEVLALTEPFAVALNAIKRIGLEKKDIKSCLIIGGGAIGLSVYLLLRLLYEVEDLKIYETNPEKYKVIKDFFPNIKFYTRDIKQLKTKNDYKSIYELGEFDFVFESAGNLQALEFALDCVKPLGKVLTLGFYDSNKVNLNKITIKSAELIGSIGGTGSFEQVLAFFEVHNDVVEKMVTRMFSLDKSIQLFKNEESCIEHIKTQIQL